MEISTDCVRHLSPGCSQIFSRTHTVPVSSSLVKTLQICSVSSCSSAAAISDHFYTLFLPFDHVHSNWLLLLHIAELHILLFTSMLSPHSHTHSEHIFISFPSVWYFCFSQCVCYYFACLLQISRWINRRAQIGVTVAVVCLRYLSCLISISDF